MIEDSVYLRYSEGNLRGVFNMRIFQTSREPAHFHLTRSTIKAANLDSQIQLILDDLHNSHGLPGFWTLYTLNLEG